MRRTFLSQLSLTAGLLLSLSTPALADTPQYTLNLKDNKFTPSELTLKADEKAKIVITNDGKETAEFESKTLHIEKVIPAGATATVTVNHLKPGTYNFVDEFHEDIAKGVIVVK